VRASSSYPPEFKELFLDLFQDNNRFNVKFQIGKIASGVSGDTKTDLSNPTLNTITISPSFLLNNNKMTIAKTMKQKLKSILRVIALCLILLLSSCEKDLYENTISENHQIILKKVSLRDSYLKSNLELFKCVDKLQNKKIDSQAKLISDNENGFYFDDQNGIYIENGKTKSYTFPIYRANSDGKIENLVFSLNKSGNYDAYTVKYDFSEEEFRYLTKQELKQKQVKYTPISYTPTSTTGRIGVMCTENWTGVTTSLYGNCTQTHSNNETCTPMTTTTWVLTSTDCYSTDGGDPGDLNNISTTPVINNADTSLEVLGITREQYNWLTKQSPALKSCVYAFAAEPEEGISRADAVYFLMSNLQVTNSLTIFLVLNNTVDGKVFTKWAIDYLMQNPNVTLQQFLNWFSPDAIGEESTESQNVTYWDNPNLTFPQQSLPTFDDFFSAYPPSSTTALQLCTQIGGQILILHNNIVAQNKKMNTCAVRLSRALNYSGVTIPNVSGTKLGDDGKYYFTFASDMNKWMKKTFGTNPVEPPGPLNLNHYRYTKAQILANPQILAGKKGIFSMVSSNPDWSSGHCDLLFDDVTCLNNCHFEGPIGYIDIWILP
jgi:hypothetical protein